MKAKKDPRDSLHSTREMACIPPERWLAFHETPQYTLFLYCIGCVSVYTYYTFMQNTFNRSFSYVLYNQVKSNSKWNKSIGMNIIRSRINIYVYENQPRTHKNELTLIHVHLLRCIKIPMCLYAHIIKGPFIRIGLIVI